MLEVLLTHGHLLRIGGTGYIRLVDPRGNTIDERTLPPNELAALRALLTTKED